MIFKSLCTAILCIILLLCRHSLFIQAFSQSFDAPLPSNIRLRFGFPDDEFSISMTMAKELMNPLSIIVSHKNNMIVAEDTKTGERVGWAQIRSLGYAGIGESSGDTSLFEDGTDDSALNRRNVKVQSIEEDVDEEMWQEFEDDPVDFPSGFASLPWTKEYQAASQAASERMKRRERKLQLELEARPQLWELSSVYVMPKYRKQGIGRALVLQVLKQQTRKRGKDVYALTLAKNIAWYEEQFGFIVEKHVPNAMTMEMNVAKWMGEELLCIRKTL